MRCRILGASGYGRERDWVPVADQASRKAQIVEVLWWNHMVLAFMVAYIYRRELGVRYKSVQRYEKYAQGGVMRRERSLGIDLMACLLTLLKPFRLLGNSCEVVWVHRTIM